MIRVLVVDDERMVCAHLRALLSTAGDIDVVGEAYDGAEAVEQAVARRVDVVLLDVRMPVVDGLAAAERLARLPHPPKVVMLTTFDLEEYVHRALKAHAVGFLLKDADPEDIVSAVRVAAGGGAMLAPSVTRRLLTEFTRTDAAARHEARRAVQGLTARERDVLIGLKDGLSNAEIGARLFLEETTIKGYVSRVLTKLGCANRTQAALIAHDAALTTRSPVNDN
ncbi:response regulator transcription factor [Nonomuraea pusilla]|uniref:Two component transcriptional regulator, LuxR family n=1 Tax=Nonomuraea pusilla TaxID=46177 RepID=A0A1H8HH48_9ACTN|nr:response regulator transcription factor [Nonomuraea pusilla]SEN54868.1 two component transcriptional regulator, LuxR family [Nonomuraea pusilla]